MTIGNNKKVVAITLSNFYMEKLGLLCIKFGVSKSEMVRMLIDRTSLFEKEKPPSSLPEGFEK